MHDPHTIFQSCYEYGTQVTLDWFGPLYDRVVRAYLDNVGLIEFLPKFNNDDVIERMQAAHDRTISESQTLTMRQYYIADGTIDRGTYGLGSPAEHRTAGI